MTKADLRDTIVGMYIRVKHNNGSSKANWDELFIKHGLDILQFEPVANEIVKFINENFYIGDESTTS